MPFFIFQNNGIYYNTLEPIPQDSSMGINHKSMDSNNLSLVEEKIIAQYKSEDQS